MSAPQSVELIKIVNALKSLRTNINVPRSFHDRMDKIKLLTGNDKTGVVNTVLDFMVHSATVPMKIETQNKNMDEFLRVWQKSDLNKNVSIDIPRGLRDLSTQYFKERWKSSFISLNVKWGKVKLPDGTMFEVPTRMWLTDGSAIYVEGKTTGLNTKKYFVGRGSNKKPLEKTTKGSVLIRKPFNSNYEAYPTPYLVKRGILFNALLKEAITTKQADVIEAIIPYLLLLRAGTDKLAELEMLAGEEELRALKDTIVKASEDHKITGDLGKLIASLNYDVKVEHLIPDLTKIFDPKITQSADKNLLAGLGMIELQGFSSNRQETILNPKVLIEEVKDAVSDWAELLEEVMYEMLERNKANHPKLSNNEIRVVPGKIKSFVTDDMRAMLRSMYDRGVISKQTGAEEIAELDFEVEVERRQKETERNLDRDMKPPVIQNLEQFTDPELEDQNKAPGTPEADNFNQAVLEHFGKKYKDDKKKEKKQKKSQKRAFETIDELPDEIKSALPIPAQLLFIKSYNDCDDEMEASLDYAWAEVNKAFEKDSDSNVWVKKSSIINYKDSMSSFVYQYFTDIYNIALDKSKSEDNALTTALAIVEKFCRKNDKGIWVKDRSVTKDQIASIDDPEVMDKLLDMELKQRKLQLLDKILENKNGF